MPGRRARAPRDLAVGQPVAANGRGGAVAPPAPQFKLRIASPGRVARSAQRSARAARSLSPVQGRRGRCASRSRAVADCRSRARGRAAGAWRSRHGRQYGTRSSARRVREQVIAGRLPSVRAGSCLPVSSGPGGCRPAGSHRCAGPAPGAARAPGPSPSGSSSRRAAGAQRQDDRPASSAPVITASVCCCPQPARPAPAAPIATTRQRRRT